MTDRIEPLVYKVPEVARLLDCAPSTVHRWIERGEVPVIRYGKVIRVPRWWVAERTGRKAA
jgi:excisionase family DNA binding protein